MRVVFDDEALDDLQRIFAWIAKDNPSAAERLVARIFARAEGLAEPEFTYTGRPGSDPGTREIIEYPYIVVYEIHDEREEIVILTVVHGAQDRSREEES